ncbi:hypothetical protein GH733_017794 [Mirounga leonina]|nr:hypothetical protein GH733_017794 [Mirounga leonina]
MSPGWVPLAHAKGRQETGGRRPRSTSSPPRAPASGRVALADPGDAAEAPRRFLSPCAPRFSRLSLPSPFGPEPREEARKPPGNGKGFGALFLFCPPAALRPSPSAGDTSKPGTMADAAWLRASAPLRGLLSRDCTGGAREAGLACADRRAWRARIGGPGGGARGVTKRTGPPT